MLIPLQPNADACSSVDETCSRLALSGSRIDADVTELGKDLPALTILGLL
jgi:hypothetical protein